VVVGLRHHVAVVVQIVEDAEPERSRALQSHDQPDPPGEGAQRDLGLLIVVNDPGADPPVG